MDDVTKDLLDEFKQYVKDEFGLIITSVVSDTPDTFEKIFELELLTI